MVTATEWYLGIRGTKTAFDWRTDDTFAEDASLGAGAAGVVAGSLVAPVAHVTAGIDQAVVNGMRNGSDAFLSAPAIQRLNNIYPEYGAQLKKTVTETVPKLRNLGSPKALDMVRELQEAAASSASRSRILRNASLAGVLGGAGLLGYGAYKKWGDG